MVAVTASGGCSSAASAISAYPVVSASPPTAGSPIIMRGALLLKKVRMSSRFFRARTGSTSIPLRLAAAAANAGIALW